MNQRSAAGIEAPLAIGLDDPERRSSRRAPDALPLLLSTSDRLDAASTRARLGRGGAVRRSANARRGADTAGNALRKQQFRRRWGRRTEQAEGAGR
jgi:hypothetical protein